MRRSFSRLAGGILVCTLFVLAPRTVTAVPIGDTIDASTNGVGFFGSFAVSPSTAVVGAGAEFQTQVTGFFPVASIDFTATDLLITSSGTFNLFASDLLFLSDATHPFTSATFVSSTIPGLGAGSFSLSGGTLTINFNNGQATAAGQVLDIAISTASPVPEPGTCGLMATGLGMLFYRVKKRRGTKTVAM